MTERQRTARVKLPHGEGTVFWDEKRQRFVAQKIVGYDGRGKVIIKTGIAKSETAAVESMRKKVKAHEAGLVAGSDRYTVKDAVTDWLTYGQGKTGDNTWEGYRFICNRHLLPVLGARKLKDLTAQEVEKWLHGLTEGLGNSSLKQLHSCLNRSVKRAYARGLAPRNVVELVDVPEGREGRASRSLTIEQAEGVLTLTKSDPMHAYIVVSILTGLRTEEVRALRWDHVDLDGDPGDAAGSAERHGVAVGPGGQRHQDQEVAAHPRAAHGRRAGASPSSGEAGCPGRQDGRALGLEGPRLRDAERHGDGRSERGPRLPPCSGTRAGDRSEGMDSARPAALVHLGAIGVGRSD